MKAAHKDYRLELRVRNANILNAMDAKRIKTVADLARKAHSDQGDVGRLVNLLDSPFRD